MYEYILSFIYTMLFGFPVLGFPFKSLHVRGFEVRHSRKGLFSKTRATSAFAWKGDCFELRECYITRSLGPRNPSQEQDSPLNPMKLNLPELKEMCPQTTHPKQLNFSKQCFSFEAWDAKVYFF